MNNGDHFRKIGSMILDESRLQKKGFSIQRSFCLRPGTKLFSATFWRAFLHKNENLEIVASPVFVYQARFAFEFSCSDIQLLGGMESMEFTMREVDQILEIYVDRYKETRVEIGGSNLVFLVRDSEGNLRFITISVECEFGIKIDSSRPVSARYTFKVDANTYFFSTFDSEG